MSQLNLDISPSQVVWPRVLLVLGLSVCFAPANVAAYLYTPLAMRGAAIGILSLLRNEGGSVGVSLSQTWLSGAVRFTSCGLREYLDPFNALCQQHFLARAQAFFVQQSGDPVFSLQLAVQQLENLPSAAGVFAGLFRHLLDGGSVDLCGHVRGIVYEALCGRESQSRRFRMTDGAARAMTRQPDQGETASPRAGIE